MRILIVEDEALIAGFVARALRAEGYATQVAVDGDQAIELLEHPWDLIVLDLLLPGRDGFAVLDAVAARGLDTPVLVLSARSRVDTKVAAFDAGRERLSRQAVLRRRAPRTRAGAPGAGWTPGAAAAPPANIGVEIDHRAARSSSKGGAVSRFPSASWRCSSTCSRSADQIVSRERLLSAVWQYGFDPRSNVVDVCVGRLRRKLDVARRDRIGPRRGIPAHARQGRVG